MTERKKTSIKKQENKSKKSTAKPKSTGTYKKSEPKKSTTKPRSTSTYKKSEPKKGDIKKKVDTKSVKRKEQPQPKPKKETYPHFRRFKKSDHPALIVGEQFDEKQREEYRYRKVMHRERDGRHLNEKIYPNPDPTDNRPMHIAKRVRHSEKKNFGKRLSWKYPKK